MQLAHTAIARAAVAAMIAAALGAATGCSHNGAKGNGDGGAGGGNALAITPANPVLAGVTGQPPPTQQFTLTLDGNMVTADHWEIDIPAIGTITQTGLFTATGTLGGKATVRAAHGALAASTTVTVQLATVQNGDPGYSPNPPPPGAGGYGGVGGDGPGGPVTPAQQQTLGGAATADPGIELLYPYDGTVWPRGLLPPLLQWRAPGHTFDSVYVHLQETGFEYKGYFAANNATSFQNLPIPAQAWQQLGDSNTGDAATVTLTFAEGSKAFGPYSMSWRFAPASLKGAVYYNSYGTYLVQNSDTADSLGKRYGAATLSIKPGATAPTIVAGVASPTDGTGCRVCHTVSADGKTLVTQASNATASDYSDTRRYDLLNDTTAGAGTHVGSGLAYPALYPDGSFLFSSAGGFVYPSSPGAPSQLYTLSASAATPVTASGLPADLMASLPAFSPDGTHLSFNFWSGTLTGAGSGDQRSLAVVDFDAKTMAFSNSRVVHTPQNGLPVTFSSFLPTSQGVVFQVELANPSSSFAYTWQRNTGELWWVDLASGMAHRLDKLNGAGYLPDNGAGGTHPPGLDATVNYEPTVNPIASGGYAWIVFTSRRLYGNVATESPWMSDPRNYDATTHITDKKLWVAAFDLNAAPGTDPSHPAFYLPAQEIHAGNARGYWTAGPCQSDGTSCDSGDQCCGGYCSVEGPTKSCTSTPPMCSALYDKCNTDADCCNNAQGVTCVNHVCTLAKPPIS